MIHWSFVTAAYAVALIATAGLLAWAYMSMRKAEAAADELKRHK
jgi:Heme exporter protein D (CcmD)